MKTVLLVVAPFAGRSVGDLITQAQAIGEVKAGAHAHDVVQVVAPGAGAHMREEI